MTVLDEPGEHVLVRARHGALVDFERSDWDLTMNLDLTSIFTMCKKVGGYTAA